MTSASPNIVLLEPQRSSFNELRKALCDTNIHLRTRRKLLESCVRSRLTYGLAACYPKEQEMKKLESCWSGFLRSMVKGGWKRKAAEEEGVEEYRFVLTNERIKNIIKAVPLRSFIDAQYLKYTGHVCRAGNSSITKTMMFAKPTRSNYTNPWIKISNLLGVSEHQAKTETQNRCEFAALIHRRTNALLRR